MSQFKFDDEANDVYVMTRLFPETTGLAQVVWATRFNYGGRHFDYPYLIVSNEFDVHSFENNFVVSVSNNPKIIQGESIYSYEENQKIFEWIKLNYSLLWYHWIDNYSDDFEYIERKIKKLSE